MHLPCVQLMISFLGFLKTCSQQATAMLERAQGEFREIRPLKSYYLYSTLWRQESTNQWLGADQESFLQIELGF